MSSVRNCVSNYQGKLKRLELGEIKEKRVNQTTLMNIEKATWSCDLTNGRTDQWTNQPIETSPNLPKLHHEREMIGCTIEDHTSPLSRVLGIKQSFNIYKPQVQGVSLSTWGVICRELCLHLPRLVKAARARQDRV